MKKDVSSRRHGVLIAVSGVLMAVVVAILLISTASVEAATDKGPAIYNRDAVLYGRTYAEWSAAWEQWADSIPTSQHPLFDNGPISQGQSGPVWFLGGKFCRNTDPNCGFNNVVRYGDVPAGKSLYVAIFNSEDSVLEDPGHPQIADLRAFCAGNIDAATVSLEVDGVPVRDLKSRFRVQSTAFVFTLPQDNFFTAVGEGPYDAGSYYPAVDDGVYVMLAPMTPGAHTIHLTGAIGGFALDVTYHINVV